MQTLDFVNWDNIDKSIAETGSPLFRIQCESMANDYASELNRLCVRIDISDK